VRRLIEHGWGHGLTILGFFPLLSALVPLFAPIKRGLYYGGLYLYSWLSTWW